MWGADRDEAIRRSRRALGELEVEGVVTTTSMHRALLDEPWFAAGDFHTGTLEEWL